MRYNNEKKWFTRLPIAHRGLYNDHGAPENTLAACEAAIQKGYAIEIDVRVSADSEVVVFHDATLENLTNGSGRVDQTPSAVLQKLTVGTSQEHIPLLQEVLALVDDRVPLFIDVKSTFFDAKRDALTLARALKDYDGTYCVMSFDPRIVAWWTGRRSLVLRSNGKKRRFVRLGNGIAGQIFHGNHLWKAYACIFAWKLFGSPGHFFVAPLEFVHLCFFQKRRKISARRPAIPILAWTVKDSDQKMLAQKYADATIFSGDIDLES